jgi:hypothetical protein
MPASSSENGEVNEENIFTYQQEGNVLSCQYNGGQIVHGHLLGVVHEDGSINMRYHQINIHGELMTGICQSAPEILPNGKIRLHETWQWTSGDQSEGESVLEEI